MNNHRRFILGLVLCVVGLVMLLLPPITISYLDYQHEQKQNAAWNQYNEKCRELREASAQLMEKLHEESGIIISAGYSSAVNDYLFFTVPRHVEDWEPWMALFTVILGAVVLIIGAVTIRYYSYSGEEHNPGSPSFFWWWYITSM